MRDLARFFALSTDLFAISSLREGMLKRVNPSMSRLLGWSEAELLSRPGFAFVHPDDISTAQVYQAQTATGQRYFPPAFRIICKDGSVRWIEWRACYYPDEDRFYSVGRDVTARKEADAARAAAQTDLKEVLESIGDAFCSVDADWRITYVNAQAARLLSRPPEELLGRIFWDVFPRTQGDPSPARRFLLQAMADRQSREMEVLSRAVNRWMLLRVYPRADGGLSAFSQDITERKQMEETLRASDAHFQAVANLGPDLLWRHDRDRRKSWYNDRWRSYTGMPGTTTDFRGWTQVHSDERGWALTHPDDLERVRQILAGALQDRGPLSYEARIRRSDGVYRWFLVRYQPAFDSDGQVTDWFGAATDIDNLKQLQNQQQLLVAELQHRTRNLISVIRSVARQALEGAASLDDFAQGFNDRLEALSRVQGFLSQSPSAGLAQLLEAELTAHGIEAKAPRVVLEGPNVDLPAGSVQTLALVVHELTTNALKHGAFARPAGSLSVSWSLQTETETSFLTLVWRESGVAMKEDSDRPMRRGFGLHLIERALPYQLSATTSIEFTPDGLVCRMVLPLGAARSVEPVAG
jgi:PAS domain S-box-containing protein